MKHIMLAALIAAPAFADEHEGHSDIGRWAIGIEATNLDIQPNQPLQGQKVSDTYGISARYYLQDTVAVSVSHFRPSWTFETRFGPQKTNLKITTLMVNKQFKFEQGYIFGGAGYSSIAGKHASQNTAQPKPRTSSDGKPVWAMNSTTGYSQS